MRKLLFVCLLGLVFTACKKETITPNQPIAPCTEHFVEMYTENGNQQLFTFYHNGVEIEAYDVAYLNLVGVVVNSGDSVRLVSSRSSMGLFKNWIRLDGTLVFDSTAYIPVNGSIDIDTTYYVP